MTRLKTRESLPPGGFQYTIPQIPDWVCPVAQGFDMTVDAIIAVSKANPRHNLPTDRETVGNLLEEFTAKALESRPGCQGFLVSDDGGPVPKFHARSLPPNQRSGAVSAGIKGAMAGAKRLTVGIGVIMDWLGAGLRPVDHALAEKRAAICVDCPLNKPANLVQWAYGRGAMALEAYMQVKNDKEAKTSLDAKLFSCQACDCHLGLKVHCPLEHILAREKPEHLAKLDPRCWILNEKEATNQ